MNKVPSLIGEARRKNQAYQQYYGPESKITNAITRDMAADQVIARRSWFPTIATAMYFSRPPSMDKYNNINMTKGRDLKNVDSYRQKAMPGTLPYHKQWETTQMSVMDDPQSAHTFLYIIIIVLAIVFISMLF